MRQSLARKIILNMLVVALLLGIFLGAAEYISLKRALNKQVSSEISDMRERVASILVIPVWDVARAEAAQIILAEMRNVNIAAFEVFDLASRTRFIAFARDDDWNPVETTAVYTHGTHLEEVPLVREGVVIGRAKIYLTDRFVLQELRRYVFYTLIKVALVEVIFILMLFFIIKKVTDRLREGIAMVDALVEGKTHRIEHYEEDDEIGDLVTSVNAAIDLFEAEQAKKMDMQKQVFHATKLASIGELAAGVAHEVNNPLMVIQGYTEFVEDYTKAGGHTECDPYLENIQSAVSRIKKIVNGLRIYARYDAEDDDLSAVDVNECVGRCCELITTIFRNHRIRVRLDLQAEHVLVKGSDGQLQQVLMNLLSNARDAVVDTPDKCISISTRNSEANVIIRVSDSGSGIPPSIRSKIYDPFFTTKRVGEGTGLGLGICYNIVQQMGGTIDFTSKEDEGTTFCVNLPMCSDHELHVIHHLDAEENDSEMTDVARVLFVDDEVLLREMFSMILEDTGIKVEVAASGNEALEKMAAQPFDLVVADFCMPGMTGGELFREINTLPEGDRVGKIILTGGINNDMGDDVEEMLDGCLTKPLSRRDIRKAIHEFLVKRTAEENASRELQ